MTYLLRPARPDDVPSILRLIRALATYEKAPGSVEATEDLLRTNLFGDNYVAHAVLAVEEATQTAVGMALYVALACPPDVHRPWAQILLQRGPTSCLAKSPSADEPATVLYLDG
jgi:hypothetical protein